MSSDGCVGVTVRTPFAESRPARRDLLACPAPGDDVEIFTNGSDLLPSDDLHHALDRVLWIGGPPDSGKTTVARLIADRHNLQTYHFDRHEPAHFARADPAEHPALWAAHPDRMSTEQRWLGSSPAEMAAATIASWSERCLMAFEDIAAMPGESPVIAEGPGFFPELLAPYLSDPAKAVWLIPTEEFKRGSAAARGKPGNRREISNPHLASHNLIERDRIMGAYILEQCLTLGLHWITVSGREDIASIAARVSGQFRSWVADADS